jgi:hypothetical protein
VAGLVLSVVIKHLSPKGRFQYSMQRVEDFGFNKRYVYLKE